MTLRQTVPLMLSDDYKERMRGEYFQLKIRMEKLSARINTMPDGATRSKELLFQQLSIMKLYEEVLETRADEEEISLCETIKPIEISDTDRVLEDLRESAKKLERTISNLEKVRASRSAKE